MLTPADLLRQRLVNQHIAGTAFTAPHEIISWLGAMQAQEWAMAKWAIGLRVPGLADADVEAAFNAGAILRTHVLRPTWHFVAPADIRWLLALSGLRVQAANAFMYRRAELDEALFRRCRAVLTKSLEGSNVLTRSQLQAALATAGIQAEGQRLGYVLMHAELDGLVCSGPGVGRQFTYALLDERVPPTPPLSREEALAELARRYFTSRGPATLHDFVWWSGLTMKDARAGVATLPADFLHEEMDGQSYVFAPQELPALQPFQTTFLLPDYDEYGISYKNRAALFANWTPASPGNGTYEHVLVVDGLAAEAWKPANKKKGVEVTSHAPLTDIQQRAVEAAVRRYGAFWTNKKE